MELAEGVTEDAFFCAHYKRKCKFVTSCCDGVYRCRFCHDEDQKHKLKREDVTIVECSSCGERQGLTEYCDNCKVKFGKYFCYECKLYDDEDKQQFHCKGCGICRVGGRNNYFHCERCDMCLPNHLEGAHKCVEKVSRSNCPVCQEDIHTSRMPSQIPPCNHLIHKNCFDEMLTNGHYACPVCGISMIPMDEIWKIYDKDIEDTPMPEEYLNLFANIKCRDCAKASLSPFHILGIKCTACGSYNTVRDKGALVRINENSSLEETFSPESSPQPGDLTPPETPNRDQTPSSRIPIDLPRLEIPTVMTPESSPVAALRAPGSGVSEHAIRRLSFTDEQEDNDELSSNEFIEQTEHFDEVPSDEIMES